MANLNKIMMIGNLTRDPQLSYLPSQTPVVEFGLATNRKWTDKATGEQREETCFVDCRCYGRSAETLNKYMRKGNQIFIEGRLQFDTWTSQDGQRRSKHRIFVQSFQFLGSPDRSARGPADREAAAPDESSASEQFEPQQPSAAGPKEDDIPF